METREGKVGKTPEHPLTGDMDVGDFCFGTFGEFSPGTDTADRQREKAVVPQPVVVVDVLVARGDHHHLPGDERRDGVLAAGRIPKSVTRSVRRSVTPKALFASRRSSAPPSDEALPPSNAASTFRFSTAFDVWRFPNPVRRSRRFPATLHRSSVDRIPQRSFVPVRRTCSENSIGRHSRRTERYGCSAPS